MKKGNKEIWLETGYQMISESGFSKVKIESIAKEINKNKSSFYHYFGDWEGFELDLLEYHLTLAKEFAVKVNNCQNIIPDMVELFLDHKTDIFFHKQLRVSRDNPEFKRCFEAVYTLFEKAILQKWVLFLKLEEHPFIATKFLTLLSENFLLKITHENYTHDWMANYFREAAAFVGDINAQSKG